MLIFNRKTLKAGIAAAYSFAYRDNYCLFVATGTNHYPNFHTSLGHKFTWFPFPYFPTSNKSDEPESVIHGYKRTGFIETLLTKSDRNSDNLRAIKRA